MGGVAILSKWPMTAVRTSLDGHRCVVVALHRPQRRPRFTVYGHAAYPQERAAFLEQITAWAVRHGEDTIVLGGFNQEATAQPIGEYLAAGVWSAMDGNDMVPTSRRGRAIDYGIGRGESVVTGRGSFPGTSDHECRWRGICMWPARDKFEVVSNTLEAGHQKEDIRAAIEKRYDDAFEKYHMDFEEAIEDHGVENVWSIISSCGEKALGSEDEPTRPRHKVVNPVAKAYATTTSKEGQGIEERRLRRVHRRLLELRRRGRDRQQDALIRSIERGIRSLGQHRDWLQRDVRDDDFEKEVKEEADKARKKQENDRISEWKQRMKADHHERLKWAMRSEDMALCDLTRAVDPHPVSVCRLFKKQLEERWKCDETMRRTEEYFPEECWRLCRQGQRQQDYEWTGKTLMDSARWACSRTAGPDGWALETLAWLGLSLWNSTAEVWNSGASRGRLPQTWATARVCGIPKQEGPDMRPLTIATAVWRIGVSAAVRYLRLWL